MRKAGHEVFDFTDPENRIVGIDKFVFDGKQFVEWSGKDPNEVDWKDFLTWEPSKKAFVVDRSGLDWADTTILLLPSGRSSHLEAGYTVGRGKDLFIFGDLPLGEFDAMYGFALGCFRLSEFHELLIRLGQK